MKVLIVATLMIVVAFQVNVNAQGQPACDTQVTEPTCIAQCNTTNVSNVTMKYGCQWVSAVITNTTVPNGAIVTIPGQCTPSDINTTATGPDYVCGRLNKDYANDDYASTFTYTMKNTWDTVNTDKCPTVVDVLNATKEYTCQVARLAYPNCTKFIDSASCLDDTNCNDAKHGCQWSQCSVYTQQINGANVSNVTSFPGQCVKNTMSKGDLMVECCAKTNTTDNQKLLKADANFTVTVTQLDNALGVCNFNSTDSTFKTCGLKPIAKPINAKSTGMAWYWYALIFLLCLCVCGACGYGGHKELQKKRAQAGEHDAEDDYYEATTGDHHP